MCYKSIMIINNFILVPGGNYGISYMAMVDHILLWHSRMLLPGTFILVNINMMCVQNKPQLACMQ